MATLEDHEARIAALEASQADYRAVLAAVNTLGANQREHSLRMGSVETRLTSVETRLTSVETELSDFRQETRARFRSVDEHLAEIKDLIVRRFCPEGRLKRAATTLRAKTTQLRRPEVS